MITAEHSLVVDTGGRSQKVSISGTSAQSTAITNSTVVICASADCFMRSGANPTALATGVDQFIPAGQLLRVSGIVSGDLLAFITSGATGSVYITPGA